MILSELRLFAGSLRQLPSDDHGLSTIRGCVTTSSTFCIMGLVMSL